MLTPMLPKLVLLSAIAVPFTAIALTAYLHNHPLPSAKTRTITPTESLSPTCATSTSVRSVVNPRHHVSRTDSYTICLFKKEIGHATDEELLARLVKGYFGGWIFAPENSLFVVLHAFGRQFIPVGFSKIQTQGPIVLSPADFSRQTPPVLHSVLFGGNFMVLDLSIKAEGARAGEEPSYIDIGFGDDRKGFAGLHRFEVTRDMEEVGEGKEGITICHSSISCNPLVNKKLSPPLIFTFHKFYAKILFRDGIAEVLK